MSREARLCGLTPILNVSDFGASMEYYTGKLGFRKLWDWGEPPDFGCVKRDDIEIRFTEDQSIPVSRRGRTRSSTRTDRGRGAGP